MKNQITVYEAVTDKEVAAFWGELRSYFKRDLFPDPEDEDRAYFLGDTYYEQIQLLHGRKQDRCAYLFFQKDGQRIGIALPVIYTSEDGKCFIMEFCVYPEFRGKGTGTACARALLEWAQTHGALYAELNCGQVRRKRFWERIGFRENGVDEWGEPLMILPPQDDVPFTVGILDDHEDWQLLKLENGFKTEIGEEALMDEWRERMQQAVKDGKITFFVARRGHRAVGMCSVVKCFSTFACADTGVFEDFYIEPVFRKQGIARKLVETAQDWCRKNGVVSMTVCCAPCDEEMYRALGFEMQLGNTFVCSV